MAHCCDTLDCPKPDRNAKASWVVALAGNPNCGKTTIFNALTGLRQKVGNYPGITVERKTGRFALPDGRWVDLIDLPGTYSLISRSPDETVAMEVLRGLRADTPAPDAVIVVVDASNLQRNLYLVSQLVELGRPMVVALNMMDIAERRGLHVSPEMLSRELGVPVIPVVGHRKQGIDRLKGAVAEARVAPLPDWALPEAMKEELLIVGGGLAILDAPGECECLQRLALRDGDPAHPTPLPAVSDRCAQSCRGAERCLDRYQAIAERLLVGDRAADIEPVARHEPVASLLASATQRMYALGIEPMQADIEAHYKWIESVSGKATATLDEMAAMGAPVESMLEHDAPRKTDFSERLDRLFMHRVWGLVVFAVIMAALFISIFWLADPIMGAFQGAVEWVGGLVASWLPAEGPLQALVNDGIFAGVGAVVVFVPQIALLFMFLSILEDSGYLARAAFLMDKTLSKVGLSGKSFIPLLSSFACAIPGIMATRTIENRRDRLATIFIAPFMSCSARLPVYTLLIGTFFAGLGAWARGGVLLACYGLGIVAAAATAWVFARFDRHRRKGPAQSFILEMPSYKLPQWSQVARQVWVHTKEFLTKAGTIIFCFSVILWALAYYPRSPAHPATDSVEIAAGAQLRQSFAGRFGRAIEPVIRPLGYDWKMGVGLVGAFAAREVFVSTMGIVYSVGGDAERTTPLADAMMGDRYPAGPRMGKAVWTPLVAVSLLIWFVLAMQCMSTLAIVRRETGGWTWPILMLVYMNGLAYVLCLIVYQAGSRWFS